MTIRELYVWAKDQGILDINISIRDSEGKLRYDFEPVIVTHVNYSNIFEDKDIDEYKEVEFR